MSRRKRIVGCIVVFTLLMGALVVVRVFTMPWDVAWVRRGTVLTLDHPDLTLSGPQLTSLLAQYHADDSARADFRCTFHERRGTIQIDGDTYPVCVVDDKFTGESIVVEGRWKSVELFRDNAANAQPRLTGDARDGE